MFSFIPPITVLNTEKLSPYMIKAIKIYHSTVNNPSYRSRGEERKDETHCIFHYTVKGSGQVFYKGKSYKTKEGEGFFNIINQDSSGYNYCEDSKEPWEFVVVSFDGGNIRSVVSELLELRVIYPISKKVFHHLCSRLYNESKTETKLTFFPRLLSLICETEEDLSLLSSKFREIVERDILLNPTICEIAKEMNISREHLQREFIKENHITPAKYIAHKRFERLCSLLNTTMKEEEISEVMNFPSLSGMIIFFKKMAEITPGQYRKNGYIEI